MNMTFVALVRLTLVIQLSFDLHCSWFPKKATLIETALVKFLIAHTTKKYVLSKEFKKSYIYSNPSNYVAAGFKKKVTKIEGRHKLKLEGTKNFTR